MLCINCTSNLPITRQYEYEDNETLHKFYGRIPIKQASSFLYFRKGGMVQNLLHNLKYHNQPEISYFLGKTFALYLKEHRFYKDIDLIVAVPIHKKKKKERGYNQLEGFAQALSEVLEVPIHDTLLYKSKNRSTQTKRKFSDRLKPTPEVFLVNLDKAESGKHILLIDDIITSGTTLESCGKELLRIPNTTISIACLALTK